MYCELEHGELEINGCDWASVGWISDFGARKGKICTFYCPHKRGSGYPWTVREEGLPFETQSCHLNIHEVSVGR